MDSGVRQTASRLSTPPRPVGPPSTRTLAAGRCMVGPLILRGSFSSTNRDREREGRARADLALYPYPPAVELDELPREGQSEPRPLLLRRAGPDQTELFEHLSGRPSQPPAH